MFLNLKYKIASVFVLVTVFAFSQNRPKDSIGTSVINIVKPYSPNVSDAFKVKETPSLNDPTTNTKKEVNYTINSFPVASTFTPAKGKAEGLQKTKPETLFDNYATLGIGSYKTLLGELYINQTLSRYENVGLNFKHHGSGGGIKDLEFNDNFFDSQLNLNYDAEFKDLTYGFDGGLQFQNFNWYGVPASQVDAYKDFDFITKHQFYNAFIAGDMAFEDAVFNSGNIKLNHFGDNRKDTENRAIINANLEIPLNNDKIVTAISADYIAGKFKRNYENTGALSYSNVILGVSPSYTLNTDDLSLNLGVTANYLLDLEGKANKPYFYPNVTLSYRLASDVLIAFGAVTGGLKQNSYQEFANKNVFVSPTLIVKPESEEYKVIGGIRGKLTRNVGYSFSGFGSSVRDMALYKNNPILNYNQRAYTFGNSFGIVYDNVKAIGATGEINVDINRQLTLIFNAEYTTYIAEIEKTAWNLPNFKSSLFLDYQITDKWFAGANLFFVGSRKDLDINATDLTDNPTKTIGSYVDANAQLGYHITPQFSVYAKLNNIASQSYMRWQNYPVQGFQAIGGLMYKFNF